MRVGKVADEHCGHTCTKQNTGHTNINIKLHLTQLLDFLGPLQVLHRPQSLCLISVPVLHTCMEFLELVPYILYQTSQHTQVNWTITFTRWAAGIFTNYQGFMQDYFLGGEAHVAKHFLTTPTFAETSPI